MIDERLSKDNKNPLMNKNNLTEIIFTRSFERIQ